MLGMKQLLAGRGQALLTWCNCQREASSRHERPAKDASAADLVQLSKRASISMGASDSILQTLSGRHIASGPLPLPGACSHKTRQENPLCVDMRMNIDVCRHDMY